MSRIRGKNTLPELAIRRALHAEGFRFRLHTELPGRPDIVLPRYRYVIFVHGCFWHRHSCPDGRGVPKTRTEFWEQKFARNVERDAANLRALKFARWTVLVIWECEIKRATAAAFARKLSRLVSNAAKPRQSMRRRE
jgi:DNA mismatch endonuclease (patch repair protein)